MSKDLCKEAALDAIKKYQRIIEDLQDIITLNYSSFRIVNNETEEEVTDLKLTNFILENVKYKAESIKANQKDIQTCYEKMEVFNLNKKD